VATADFLFGGGGLFEREVRREMSVGAVLGTEFFAAVEVGLGEVHWRKRLGLNALGEFCGTQVENVGCDHGVRASRSMQAW
jgi:hypothetical protein